MYLKDIKLLIMSYEPLKSRIMFYVCVQFYVWPKKPASLIDVGNNKLKLIYCSTLIITLLSNDYEMSSSKQ